MKKFITKTTVFLLLVSVLLSLCACGEAPNAVTTDNRPTVIITEPTSVITTEETTKKPKENIYTDTPVIEIDPVPEDEAVRFLFSKALRFYLLPYSEDAARTFIGKTYGGSSFVVTSAQELNAFHTFLESANEIAGHTRCAYGEEYDDLSQSQLYGDIPPDFFDSSVLVFYIAQRCVPHGDAGKVSEVTLGPIFLPDNLIVISTGNYFWDRVWIPEEIPNWMGVSCWAVSRKALAENEIMFRSPLLGNYLLDWLVTPDSVNNLDLDEIPPDLLAMLGPQPLPKLQPYAEKSFTTVDDPTLSPAPEGYKIFLDLEGSLTPQFKFKRNTTIEPVSGYVKSEIEFENLLSTLEFSFDTPGLEFSLEKEYFRDYDILYVIGRGGTPESCYYLAQGDSIELHIFPDDSDGLYISFFRVSKNLGEHFDVELIFY